MARKRLKFGPLGPARHQNVENDISDLILGSWGPGEAILGPKIGPQNHQKIMKNPLYVGVPKKGSEEPLGIPRAA